MAPLLSHYAYGVDSYVGHVLGHEGKGSLTAALKVSSSTSLPQL